MYRLAKYASIILSLMAAFFVTTASAYVNHRPEAPEELLKK
jgi:cyclic lactone autoinducer peptide